MGQRLKRKIGLMMRGTNTKFSEKRQMKIMGGTGKYNWEQISHLASGEERITCNIPRGLLWGV